MSPEPMANCNTPGWILHDYRTQEAVFTKGTVTEPGQPAKEYFHINTIPPREIPDWAIIIHDEPGGRELLKIYTDGTVSGEIEDAGPAAQEFVKELRGLTEAIRDRVYLEAKVEALREAAFELKTNPVKGDTLFTRIILPSCNTFAVFQLLARADNLEKP
ncbi:hypothetical protein CGQ24_08275 [Arthrobacter sp. 7749]|nr:hypothetical protein CGQ24_08275 [Arthrobacter sp. 7749]